MTTRLRSTGSTSIPVDRREIVLANRDAGLARLAVDVHLEVGASAPDYTVRFRQTASERLDATAHEVRFTTTGGKRIATLWWMRTAASVDPASSWILGVDERARPSESPPAMPTWLPEHTWLSATAPDARWQLQLDLWQTEYDGYRTAITPTTTAAGICYEFTVMTTAGAPLFAATLVVSQA